MCPEAQTHVVEVSQIFLTSFSKWAPLLLKDGQLLLVGMLSLHGHHLPSCVKKEESF